MRSPRRNRSRRLALVMGLVLVPVFPATTWAGLAPPQFRTTTTVASAPIPNPTPVRRIAPPAIFAPLVVQAPLKPVDFALPMRDSPGFPAEVPNTTPEPASLVTGLVGTGLALGAWVRRRRLGKADDAEEIEEESLPELA